MPWPIATNTAVGPLKLSIQPGKGSRQDEPTIEGLTMTHGMSLHSSNTRYSVIAFVNVYVFG